MITKQIIIDVWQEAIAKELDNMHAEQYSVYVDSDGQLIVCYTYNHNCLLLEPSQYGAEIDDVPALVDQFYDEILESYLAITSE